MKLLPWFDTKLMFIAKRVFVSYSYLEWQLRNHQITEPDSEVYFGVVAKEHRRYFLQVAEHPVAREEHDLEHDEIGFELQFDYSLQVLQLHRAGRREVEFIQVQELAASRANLRKPFLVQVVFRKKAAL